MDFAVDPVAQGLTKEGVVAMCDRALAHAKALADGIRALHETADDALAWETTFGAFDGIVFSIQEAIQVPQLISLVHADADVRAAAMVCEPKVDAFVSELYLDEKIASVLRRFAAKEVKLERDQEKFVEEVLREYRRNGLELPEEQRAHLRKLNERITELGQAFDVVLSETTLSLEVHPDQLRGMPASFLASHPVQQNGKVKLTTNYPDLVPIQRYAEDRTVARDLYVLSENRGAEKNIPTLNELLKLRHEKATLLGYATWADYTVETRMAKTVQNVETFLAKLHAGLIARREAEVAELLDMQKRVLPEDGDMIMLYNSRFLEDRVRKEKFALDSQKVSEYFAMHRVTQGVLDVASKLYGITFEKIDAPVWHPDVQPLDVQRDGVTIGRVYLDLHPRDGKYKHAAVFGLRETMTLPDGSRQLPIAALVCNFPGPTAPALMGHDDVVTYFHEFGHLLHHVLSDARLASFSGTNVARDFVEAPSQMFEEWAWDRDVLRSFAVHHETGEPLPEDLLIAMNAARIFGEAIATERQLFLATYDFALHTREPGFDVEVLATEMYADFSSFSRVAGTHFPATFGHLIGYSAAYYSYQWALSIAYDMFTRFQTEGIMNTQTAKEYFERVLAPGSSDEEMNLVEHFLGRPSTPDAYLNHLGIK